MRLQKHGFFAKKGKFGAITRKFRGGDSVAASTVVDPTVVAPIDAASTTTQIPAAVVAPVVDPAANSGANSGANKTKVSKGPQKYDEDGHPINKQKSNKKKSSPKTK